MKKFDEFEKMNPMERRKFLRNLAFFLASPLIPLNMKFAINEMLLGTGFAEAQAAARPTFFIEINFRDQWDFAGVFVAPGIVSYPRLERGAGEKVALFDDPNSLLRAGNNFYCTREGRALEPHLNDIALVELCELSMGQIHGHEAANGTRSPGRSYNGGPGRLPMFLLDPRAGNFASEDHYSSTPTPAVLHNYVQRQLDPSLRPGIAYKGTYRSLSAIYHFSANLQDAQLDRYQSTTSIVRAFQNVTPPNTTLTQHSQLITSLISRFDESFVRKFRVASSAHEDHKSQIGNVHERVGRVLPPFNLALSNEERAFWSAGVPHDGHPDDRDKAQIWEQAAFASKLITNRVVRTVALEFDYEDVHSGRDETVLRALGNQTALPLRRLIDSIKAAGMWDETIIAVYTTDGGRTPMSASSGDRGKNSVMLCGGRVRGGYYGDIRPKHYGNRMEFVYHKPDESTGNPVPDGAEDNGRRISGGSIWKTVMKAAGIPSDLYNSFPDTRNEPELNFMLKG
ncbi:MAG TPA: DUF1501 domain-containing protein [Bdellovibrionota bacterium]|nr:DUF1501 domain-containing protein [Bdellovibrionota bacterium]